ncbi:MAG: hypothetical protein DRJ38_07630 [Thermoprotei archaeon]|nr:MAG: hypothetical protein DRJ38_07630 [Thermoprotei archaeon]
MRRRDLWGPLERGPRRLPPGERLKREIIEELSMEFRRDLRIGLARLYRALRRDIRMAVLEAAGKAPSPAAAAAAIPEVEEEEEKKGFFEDLFKFDVKWDDIIKYGGAAIAGALAVLIITHWDDIYNFFTKAKQEGMSEDQMKQGLTDIIQKALSSFGK